MFARKIHRSGFNAGTFSIGRVGNESEITKALRVVAKVFRAVAKVVSEVAKVVSEVAKVVSEVVEILKGSHHSY